MDFLCRLLMEITGLEDSPLELFLFSFLMGHIYIRFIFLPQIIWNVILGCYQTAPYSPIYTGIT